MQAYINDKTCPVRMKRIETIDVVRGLVMVIMALDHVRDLLHTPALTQDPTNLATTTAPVFLSRWITHLCAPTFVFLAGTSVYLSLRRKGNSSQQRAFLFKRGLVLIGLELTVINFAFWTDILYRSVLLQVIFVIGGGLMLLSGLVRFQVRTLLIAGFVIVATHDLLTLVPPFTDPAARLGWSLLFRTDVFPVSPGFTLLVGYPLVPWFGILLLGYGFGPLFERPLQVRRAWLLQLGAGLLVVFGLLRWLNVYGDAAPWQVQSGTFFTLLSFLNVSKYPPSLLYAALMLGIMLVLLGIFDGKSSGFSRLLTVYGQVPLFYYLVHWYLVKAAMIGMLLVQGYGLRDMPIGPLSFGRPAGAGVSLPVVYGVWLALVGLLYPLCRWYVRYKAAHPEVAWTRYV